MRDTGATSSRAASSRSSISFLLIAVTGYFLWSYATKPSYTAVQTNLNPADTNRVTQALASAGVTYKVANGGTEVDVLSSQQSKAQVALASKGVGPGNHASLADMSSLGLGATDFQQQVKYQRALEGEIASQIEGIDGVTAAQVQLVLPAGHALPGSGLGGTRVGAPDGQRHARGAPRSPASRTWSPRASRDSIRTTSRSPTTSASCSGRRTARAAVGGTFGATAKLAQQQAYDAQVAAEINAMLARTLGPDKAEARVNAELDLNQVTSDSVTYDGKGCRWSSRRTTRACPEAAQGAGGAAGTAGNIPPVYRAARAAQVAPDRRTRHQSGTTTNGANKVISHETVAPGTVEKQSVALIFDSSIKPSGDHGDQEHRLRAWSGSTQPRRHDHDRVACPSRRCRGGRSRPRACWALPLSIMAIAKYVVGGIGALVFLFLVRKNLKRREGEARRAGAHLAARDLRPRRRSPRSRPPASPTACRPSSSSSASRFSARPRRSSRSSPSTSRCRCSSG